jgi:Spy/CpxP family protein refolding chaperone
MNMSRNKKAHLVIISLLIGFALGTVFGQWRFHHGFHAPWEKRGFSRQGEKEMKNRMLDHMSKELHLSEQQKQQVAAIFEAKQPQMMALHEEMRPKFEALRNATRVEIKKLLTPEQQTKADQMEAEMEKRRGGHEGPPPGP